MVQSDKPEQNWNSMKYTATIDGRTQSVKKWCEELGLNYQTAVARIRRGCSPELSVTKALQVQNTPIDGHKTCTQCKCVKPVSEFTRLSRRAGNELVPACKACDSLRTYNARKDRRKELLSAYSVGSNAECAVCGESRIAVLDLDHIAGGGNKDRNTYSNPHAFYNALRAQGYPPGYRVLCRNCNWIEYLKLHKRGEY